MTTSLAPPITSSFFGNTTAPPVSCLPCTSMQVVGIWRGTWSQNSSLPAIRTLQPYVDPADNLTSTSTICNSNVLPQYQQTAGCNEVVLDDNCELVCNYQYRGASIYNTSVTMTGTGGNYLYFNQDIRVQGGVTTTDSNGVPTCITSRYNLSSTSYTYTGPASLSYVPVTLGDILTSVTTVAKLVVPELSLSYPEEGAFSQCTLLQTGDPPVFLTPANQIILPAMTFSAPSNTAETTSAVTTEDPSTTARPPTSNPEPTPSRTSTTAGPSAPPQPSDNPDEEDDEPEPSNPPTPPQPTDDGEDSPEPSQPPPPPQPTDDGDDSPEPSNPPTPPQPTEGGNDSPEPSNPPTSPQPTEGGNDSPEPSNPPTPPQPTEGGNDSPEPSNPPTSPQPSDGGNGSSEPSNPPTPPQPSDGGNGSPEPSNPPTSPQPTDGGDDSPDPPTSPQPTEGGGDSPGGSNAPTPPQTSGTPQDENDGPEVSAPPVPGTSAGGSNPPAGSPTAGAPPTGEDTTAIPQPGGNGPATSAGTPASSTAPIAVIPGVTIQPGESSTGVVVGGTTTINAGGPVAVGSGTTFSVLPSTGGIVAIADGQTSTIPMPAPVTGVAESFVRPITTAAPGVALPGQTIAEGESAVAVGGTTFSALPSGAGVVAVSEGGSTTIQQSEFAGVGISTVEGSSGAFVLPEQTLAVGGSAAVVSGTTYSILPEGSGVAVVANGESSVIPLSEATNVPGIGPITAVISEADGYVLDGSVSVTAGGAAATISGTVYSALPSGLGVVVNPSGDEDDLSSFIEQGISGEDAEADDNETYIIGSDLLSAAEGSAVTVSGVVYSALPSGSGILVIANGESTTIELGATGSGSSTGSGNATATGDAGPDESVVAFTGAASSIKDRVAGLTLSCLLVFMGLTVTCAVL